MQKRSWKITYVEYFGCVSTAHVRVLTYHILMGNICPLPISLSDHIIQAESAYRAGKIASIATRLVQKGGVELHIYI